jgi:Fur family transcriptional regulator, ferric uptake regulator
MLGILSADDRPELPRPPDHDADEEPREMLRNLLHARGERLTPARQAVLRVLVDGGSEHLRAEEIVARVAQQDPKVHRASVHRALDLFVRMGMVQHLHPGHSPVRYHLISGAEEHVHLQCRICGELFDLPAGLMSDLAARLRASHGFELEPGHVALSGTCHACLAAARPDSPS